MKIKKFQIHFATVFALTFVVNAIVVYVWNIIRHGEGVFNWGTTFFFAITLVIILPLSDAWRSKKQ